VSGGAEYLIFVCKMEQFARECLEMESEANNDKDVNLSTNFSMDKVYERAAMLVQKTLDVEGAVVMDVSHGDVLETINAGSNVSIIVHSATGSTGPVAHQLSADEYTKLYDTFVKYPDGRISEGLVPAPLRKFIPNGIQYALSESIFPELRFPLLCVITRLTPCRCAHFQHRQAPVCYAVRV